MEVLDSHRYSLHEVLVRPSLPIPPLGGSDELLDDRLRPAQMACLYRVNPPSIIGAAARPPYNARPGDTALRK